jgi:hypothetical protein
LRDVIPAEAGIQVSFAPRVVKLFFEAECDIQRYNNFIPFQGLNQYRPLWGRILYSLH